MANRPVIGIPTQTLEAEAGRLPACWIMSQRYVQVLRSVGAVPWLIPLLPDDPDTLREIFDRIDGLFLTGGVDVDPPNYGEPRHNFCGLSDPPRDQVELMFIRWALATHKPILAVCRGVQIINVALGGTLYQDVATQVQPSMKHDYFPTKENPHCRHYIAHGIEVAPNTRLSKILGGSRAAVNSMHHQAIKTVAPGLVVNSYAPDGVIEGLEGTNGQFMIGVQWHPEELTESDPGMKRLFTSFISESCKNGH